MKIGGKQAHLGMPHSEIQVKLDWKKPSCKLDLVRLSTLFRIQDKVWQRHINILGEGGGRFC